MNSIVSKFVGLPVHPTARMMKTKIIDFLEQNEQTFGGEFIDIYESPFSFIHHLTVEFSEERKCDKCYLFKEWYRNRRYNYCEKCEDEEWEEMRHDSDED